MEEQNKNLHGLVILEEVERKHRYRRRVRVKCYCGNIFAVDLVQINIGHTRSCGCLRNKKAAERKRTHGLSEHPIYGIWSGIKARCYNVNTVAFKSYGGRGIEMCDEWKNDFMPFYTWAVANNWAKGMEVDRINGDGNYEPGNCRIVTKLVNIRNIARNRHCFFNGQTKVLTEWCLELNLNYRTTLARLVAGRTIEDAFTSPVLKYKQCHELSLSHTASLER